jgi:hypothetical protein
LAGTRGGRKGRKVIIVGVSETAIFDIEERYWQSSYKCDGKY